LAGTKRSDFSAAVVIPALAEGENLLATLASLGQNPPAELEGTLVVVVVNHRPDAEVALQQANHATLLQLSEGPIPPGLELVWIDAATPGLELPLRDGGVGMARKIGFDLALTRLDHRHPSPLLISLDADTLVRPDYLSTLRRHFAGARQGAAVLPFCHQQGATAAAQRAIDRYELYLRHYVLGLFLAGSPYAFHTVGSAIACRADAYARMGGMNRRRAGEDFYFLQQLAKTCGVATLSGTLVYPSSRSSRRTPFGTGPSVARLLAGEEDAVLFFRPETFRLLGAWLALATETRGTPGEEVLAAAGEISPILSAFLGELDLPRIWRQLQQQHRDQGRFVAAFHTWFDGLKTLQLIHRLCASGLPKTSPENALPDLMTWAGLKSSDLLNEQISRLRDRELAGDFS
jgi:hypothetical protein